MPKIAYRFAAVVVASLWTIALFAPFHSTHGYLGNPASTTRGYELLKFGALGPLALNISWYANFPFFVSVWRMLNGGTPGFKLPLVSVIWAYSALLPYFTLDFEQTGRFEASFLFGPAVWLWLTAFTTNAGLGVLAAIDI